MRKSRPALVFLLLFSFFSGSLPQLKAQNMLKNGEETSGSNGLNDDDSDQTKTPAGLRFRLSQGKEQPAAREKGPQTLSTALSELATDAVLRRLPPIKSTGDDTQDFAFRERSLPRPRTGQTISASFPGPGELDRPNVPNTDPLQVLRVTPEGAVAVAPEVSVTFSQPMVAVTSMTDLEAVDSPVQISPQPEGKWRWLGTRTLAFIPQTRFPAATEYSVTVPGGTRAVNGNTLASAKTWKFVTPPLTLKSKYPEGESNPRDPIIFLGFDQRIEPVATFQKVRVSAGGRPMQTRPATAAEVARDKTVTSLAKSAQEGRWLALRVIDGQTGQTKDALPGAQTITVRLEAGAPSAEGPRVTTAAQAFSFKTFGPFEVTGSECGYQKKCTPSDPIRIAFSNQIDAAKFSDVQVKVYPATDELKTVVYGNQLVIQGMKKGRTTYRVTLDKSIQDQFGQTLSSEQTLTFNVGAAPPMLQASTGPMVVLEPTGPRKISVFTVNQPYVKVSLYKVVPEDWDAYTNYVRNVQGYSSGKGVQSVPPGRLAFSKSVEIGSRPDELIETQIDLTPALTEDLGQVVAIIEPAIAEKNQRNQQTVYTWVQSTQIGLQAFVDAQNLVGWATALKDGTPLDGVELSINARAGALPTGNDGLVKLPLPSGQTERAGVLIARRGGDVAILPEETSYWSYGPGNWIKRTLNDNVAWYVFDDRKMYRPGEEVHIKGWLRRIGAGPTGDVGLLNVPANSVSYTLRDSQGNEISKGELNLNVAQGFDTALKLPPTMNLGNVLLDFQLKGSSLPGSSFQHQFHVQEFRRPEYEVTANTSEGPHFVGGSAEATVTAAYFAGGGLTDADVSWNVTSNPAQFTPPNRDDYTFGKWVPWWRSYGRNYAETVSQTFTGKTDESGKHRLHIDFDSVNPPRASSVTAQASVTDVNRQQWTATTTMLVHPAELYVGLKSDRTFVQQGQQLEVQAIVTDLDGKAIVNRDIKMRAVLHDWVQEKGQWVEKEVDAQDCAIKSAEGPVKCSFMPKKGGVYTVKAQIMDDRERRNESELTLWVAGGKQPPKRDVEQEEVQLIPDRKEYQPGQSAQILVQAPFYPAEGVLTLRRDGIVKTERFRMDGPSTTLNIPIVETYLPNVHVQVDLSGAAERTDDKGVVQPKLAKRPAFAKGELNLSIPPTSRKLDVKAIPRDKALEPGGETVVNVEVHNAAGQPGQGSEVAVVVVDEAVLALTGYKLNDPMSAFYTDRGEGVTDFSSRSSIKLGNPEQFGIAGGALATVMSPQQVAELPINGRMMRAAKMAPPPKPVLGEPEASPISVRQNFDALAVFSPSVKTDANGRAEIKVKLPDNLTRYRVMAVAVEGGKQFGMGESSITARMPLMVRPSAPRFLNFGDKFELPVVVQNQTDSPMEVEVAVRASNAELTAGGGRLVTVPANDRVKVLFPVNAMKAGKAKFALAAVSGKYADAAEVELPVWTPATTEAFATYGEIDNGATVQPFAAPSNTYAQFGGLEITTSSTQLQELTDAVIYLSDYPYECSEQISSRLMSIAALRDVLAAFKSKDLPSADALKASVARDLERLKGMQNDDGGFGFWKRGDESWPYISIHVAHALERAKEKGYVVDEKMLSNSKQYLRDIEKRIPANYSIDAKRTLIAYALCVRNRFGDRDTGRARRLITEAGLEKLPLEAVGWLLPVLSGDAGSAVQVEAIRRHLNNRVTDTAGAAHFATSYSDGEQFLLHSSRRVDGVILEALIGDQPDSDLIPKIVRGLLAARSKGRWANTQENAFILLALDRYFNKYEKVTPDFVARIWLGDRYAGESAFKGRSTDLHQLNVSMKVVMEKQGPQDLTMNKEGQGRLYYRIGMKYAPTSLKLAPADYGFAVERVYEAVDDASDVTRDKDGTWHFKAGARVRVRLTMTARSRRYHVALVDPLPAGLEALNPALAVTGKVPADTKDLTSKSGWWWWRQWFEHQNMRDERVEAFTSLLWEGVYDYSYVARATTPGEFVVPPAKAEEMYSPETFGRSGTDKVVIQ